MAYVITDSCVSCGTCEGECPVGAISAGDGKYEIDADTCIDFIFSMKLMQIPVLIAEHAQAAAPQALLSRADFYIGTA